MKVQEPRLARTFGSWLEQHPKPALCWLTAIPRFAVLLGYAMHRDTPFGAPGHDGYLQIAQNLVAHSFLGVAPDHLLNRGPMLPLLLSPGVLLGHPEIWSDCLQLLASVGTCLLVFAGCMALTKSIRASFWAAALVTLDPWLIWFVKIAMTPVTATFFVAAAFFFFAKLVTTNRPAIWSLCLGVSCALATLDHPALIALAGGFTLAVLIVLWGWRSTNQPSERFPYKTAGVSLVCIWAAFFFSLLPYTIRNYRDAGRFVLVSDGAGYTYLMGTSHFDLSAYPWGNLHWPYWVVTDRLHATVADLDPQYFTINDRYYPELNQLARADFKNLVEYHPGYLAKRTAVMALWFFAGDYSKTRTLAHCVFLTMVIAAWWVAWRNRGFIAIAPFLAIILPGWLLHSLTMSLNGHAAYSIPYIVPMAIPLALALAKQPLGTLSKAEYPIGKTPREVFVFE